MSRNGLLPGVPFCALVFVCAINLANEIAHTKTNAQKGTPGKRPLRDIYGYLLVRESYTKFPSSQRPCRCTVNCEPSPSRRGVRRRRRCRKLERKENAKT